MKIPRPDLAALAVCVVIVAGMVALALAHVGIPDVFPYLATAALSAGAGVAVAYTGPSGTQPAHTVATELASDAAAAVVAAAVPEPRAAEPAPVATHAP